MNNLGYKLSIIFLALCAFLCVVLLFMLFYPIAVIKPNVQPYKVLTKVVSPGGKFVYQVDACKKADATATIQRRFVGDVIYFLPSQDGTVKPGCSKSNIEITVPDDVSPGKYYLDLVIEYRLNFLTSRIYYFDTESFLVATPSAK